MTKIKHTHNQCTGNIVVSQVTLCRTNMLKALRYVDVTSVGTLIVASIYLKLIQNRYMFRSFTVLQRSHQGLSPCDFDLHPGKGA